MRSQNNEHILFSNNETYSHNKKKRKLIFIDIQLDYRMT